MVTHSDPYDEMAAIIARFAMSDEESATPIEGLYFNRRSSPTQPIHTRQWPCFAMVVQGAKSLTLGDEIYRYGVGDYLVVSLDLPVLSRVTEASPDQPHLGLGMAINPERLNEVMAGPSARRDGRSRRYARRCRQQGPFGPARRIAQAPALA